MGDRANVFIKGWNGQGGVFLYTHWDGTELPTTVQRALAKRWRWNDHAYLTRIIFCEMVKGNEDSETGFGISGTPPDGASRVLGIDCDAETITFGQAFAEGFNPTGTAFTFEQFIALSEPGWDNLSELVTA